MKVRRFNFYEKSKQRSIDARTYGVWVVHNNRTDIVQEGRAMFAPTVKKKVENKRHTLFQSPDGASSLPDGAKKVGKCEDYLLQK